MLNKNIRTDRPMTALSLLKWLVDSGNIDYFVLFYPNFSPTLREQWVGSCATASGGAQIFALPAADFLGACENLIELIKASENISMPEVSEKEIDDDFKNAEPFIQGLVDFIIERIDAGDESWLMGLEYNQEDSLPERWSGVINGAEWSNMQISKTGSTLEQVCREQLETVSELPT